MSSALNPPTSTPEVKVDRVSESFFSVCQVVDPRGDGGIGGELYVWARTDGQGRTDGSVKY